MADEKKPNKAVNSIIIRDLSYHCNEEDLIDLFQRVNVTWSHLKVERGENHNHSLLHAFVETNTHEEAVHLINTLQGTKLIGRVMKLQLCKDSQGSGNSSIAAMPAGSIEAEKSRYQIHVKYQSQSSAPEAAQQGKVTEETIEQLYQQYGEIEDVVVKRHHEDYDQYGNVARQNGYGFLYFKNPESSFFVVEKVPQLILNNSIVFTCCFSYKAAETIVHKQPHQQHHNHNHNHHQQHPSHYSPPRGPVSDSGSTSLDDRSVNPPPLVSPNYIPQQGNFTPPPPAMQQAPPMQTQVPEYFVLPPFLPSPRTNPNMPQPYLPSAMPLPPPHLNQPQQYLPPNQAMIPPGANVAYLYPQMQQAHQMQQQQFVPRNMLPPPNSNFHPNGVHPMNQPPVMFTAQGPAMFNMSGSISPVSTPSTPSPPPSSFPQHFAHAMSVAAGHPSQEQSFPRGMVPRQVPPQYQQQPQPGVPYQVPVSQQMMNGQQPFPRQQQLQFQHPPRPNKAAEKDQQQGPPPSQQPFNPPQYQPPQPQQPQFFQQYQAQLHQQMQYQAQPQGQYPPQHQQAQYQQHQQFQQQSHNHQQHQQNYNGSSNHSNYNHYNNVNGQHSRQHGKGNDRRGRGPPARYDPPNQQNHQRRQHHDNHHHSHPGHYQHQSNHNELNHYNHHNNNNHRVQSQSREDDEEDYHHHEHVEESYHEQMKPSSSSSPPNSNSDYPNPSTD